MYMSRLFEFCKSLQVKIFEIYEKKKMYFWNKKDINYQSFRLFKNGLINKLTVKTIELNFYDCGFKQW